MSIQQICRAIRDCLIETGILPRPRCRMVRRPPGALRRGPLRAKRRKYNRRVTLEQLLRY